MNEMYLKFLSGEIPQVLEWSRLQDKEKIAILDLKIAGKIDLQVNEDIVSVTLKGED